MEEFKSIFYMEYAHRVLGRVIGLAYAVPFLYLLTTRRLTPSLALPLTGFGLLLGFQGFLGWYMVKSGLEDSLMQTPGAVPRVSQYRLAAHLGTALLLYGGMLGTAIGIRRDWAWAQGEKVCQQQRLESMLQTRVGRRFRLGAWGLLGLVLLTAVSGEIDMLRV